MKPKFQQLYMDWAHRAAELSYARRLKVGAVVVKDDTVISYGYNGMPAGWDNNCEFEFTDPQTRITELVTRAEVLHAERNALDKLAKGNNGGLEATMFITHAPCLECAKSIYGAGISTVYYGEDYRAEEGILFLKKCGVNIQKLIKEDK